MSAMNRRQNDPAPEVLFSMNSLRRAWRLVRRKGTSPGTDGVSLKQFETNLDDELNRLRQQLIGGTYQPHPVRRFYIKKASGSQRPICIWALRDRVAQRVVLDYLTPTFELLFLKCSYGFRPGLSPINAVEAIVRFRNTGREWVLDADIKDCFGSIDPDLLMGQVRKVVHSKMVKQLIHQWLNTPVHKCRGEVAGISQGGVISPSLANLYLHQFDQMVMAALPQAKLIRFADDFIILSRIESEATWSIEVARRSLANLRLSLNMRKTRIVNFDEGFKFLGFEFKGDQYRNLTGGTI
jgi:RNA-directed DNA polymerase